MIKISFIIKATIFSVNIFSLILIYINSKRAMLSFCLVEDTHEKDLADLQKEIGEKDKEILIYIETIEQGKKERLELKDQLKKLEEEREDWEKEKEAFKKRIHEMENAGFFNLPDIIWLLLLGHDEINYR